MAKFKANRNDIGKTLTYTDKNGKKRSNRIIAVDVKHNIFLIMGDFPSDFPIRIIGKYVIDITGETSKTVCTIRPDLRDKPKYQAFIYNH